MLGTLGAKLTERFASAVALPGLAYVAISGWAWASSGGHALDPVNAAVRFNHLWTSIQRLPPAGPVVAGSAVVLTAIAAGLGATAIGDRLVHRVWCVPAPGWLLSTRRRWWKSRNRRAGIAPPVAYQPSRMTPAGDAFELLASRLVAQYGLSLADAWPRVAVIAGPDTRLLVATANHRYRADTHLAAWGVLLMPLAALSWPVIVPALTCVVIGTWRSAASARTLTVLIESAIDVHQRDLAASLGVDLAGDGLTPKHGHRINNILDKRAHTASPSSPRRTTS